MTEKVDRLLEQAREIDTLITAIKPILAGVDPHNQGAVLAELTAIWIWEERIHGDNIEARAATLEQRRQLLAMQEQAVRSLLNLFDIAGRSDYG